MHAPKCKPRTHLISDFCFRASRFLLFLVVGIVPLAAMDFSVKASEKAGGDRPGQASVKADEPEAGSAESRFGLWMDDTDRAGVTTTP